MFQTIHAPESSEPAPDGSRVFPLVRTERASAGLIHLEPGETTIPVRHRTIEEIWYVIQGYGQLWRNLGNDESTESLSPGTCVTIPTGASFQFRSHDESSLRMLMLTVPPWPGASEADLVEGPWEPVPPR